MRAFIVRPFADPFPNVEKVLIDPALTHHGIRDRTTLDITRSGNIRVDMFHRLLTADLVIADLSIHNANVFYELGIRHSLRKQHTIMIRSEMDKLPFDLFTDRYFLYDKDNPAAALQDLIKFIGDTLRERVGDSPVFQLLPKLVEQRAEVFLPIAPEFGEAVDLAQVGEEGDTAEDKIASLALLASEVDAAPWRTAGLRRVGGALFKLKAFVPAATTFEKIREREAGDVEANQLLATIYQKLGKLELSDQALDRVLADPNLAPAQRAESLALRASNAKTKWIRQWANESDQNARQQRAIKSPELMAAYDDYHDGFLTNLQAYYPGVNAVASLMLLTELAKKQPTAWENSRKNQREARRIQEECEDRIAPLAAAVEISLDAAMRNAKERDLWAEVSLADLTFYRNAGVDKTRTAYERVAPSIDPFQVGSIRNQLQLFVDLGVLADAAQAALDVLPAPQEREPAHHVLFTGHRIDDLGREKPRFPPEKEEDVKREIGAKLDEIRAKHPNLVGISGAASGGDILFHEACIARGIESVVYLALPREEYAVQSVASAGAQWLQRFHAVLGRRRVRVMQTSEKLPVWLADRDPFYLWQRSNLWILNRALAGGGQNMTMLALWNGQTGDGPGGTADMIEQAKKRGATVLRVAQDLFQ